MELWDVYDRNGQLTGRTAIRGGKPMEAGEYHLVVHILAFNRKGELLIQRRQLYKDGWPGWWDVSAAGSVLKGEDSLTGARRELGEEVGILAEEKDMIRFCTMWGSNWFDTFYFTRFDGDPASLTLQTTEVMDVRFAGEEEVMEMVRAGKFIPYRHFGEMFIPNLFSAARKILDLPSQEKTSE